MAEGTERAAAEQQIDEHLVNECPRQWEQLGDDHYRLTLETIGVSFEIDRLRRDHFELKGELSVRCELAGARTYGGVLIRADFNVSSERARADRAKALAKQAITSELDWLSLLEEFCQRVLEADRIGKPAVDLRTLERPSVEDALMVEGLKLPRRHPAIIFGDGAAGKSYIALYLAGKLAYQGLRIGLFDWELAGADHRDRLERLFGAAMPKIMYARCEKPLIFETDRLTRIARESRLDYVVYDSIAFACDGAPESAEVAGYYFRAVRQIGVGSLHIAHISKAEGNDQKPFGSTFWSNGSRSTWFVKATESSPDTLNIGLFNRKSNLGRLSRATGFQITFADDTTTFKQSNPVETPELAVQMSIKERLQHLLKHGAMSPEAISEEIEKDVESIKRTVRRYKQLFTVIEGGKLALLERHA